jgi:hypothetical protein
MEYLKVEWQHDFPAYPVLIFSELGEGRYETRKIEVYADGRQQCWDQRSSNELGEVTVLSLAEIDAMEEFTAVALTPVDFASV